MGTQPKSTGPLSQKSGERRAFRALSWRGNVELLFDLLQTDSSVAVIGPRDPGAETMEKTRELARRLWKRGWGVITDIDQDTDRASSSAKLYWRGDGERLFELLEPDNKVSVIVSRDASEEGMEKTRELARWRAERGGVVIASFVPGIDRAAFSGELLWPKNVVPWNRSVAIIGSRDASEEAREETRELAYRLAERGWVVVSGFARGIDRAAFDGALAHPRGRTIAVLAQGLDTKLPRELSQALAGQWRRLLVVSPFAKDAPWSGANAMRRNAVIVALARVVIVGAIGPEKTQREDGRWRQSGTWNAVATALKRNREVWIPDWLRDDEHVVELRRRYPQVRVVADPLGELEQYWQAPRTAGRSVPRSPCDPEGDDRARPAPRGGERAEPSGQARQMPMFESMDPAAAESVPRVEDHQMSHDVGPAVCPSERSA